MTLMERIRRAGQDVEPGWEERDVDRVWQGLRRKRRRRAVAGAGVVAAAVAGVAVWAILIAPGRNAVVERGGPAPQSHRDEPMRFADGSTAVPWGGREASLTVVEDTPARVVVALANGGARFEVIPRPERVFSVRAGDVTVNVLGTSFSVERVADRVGVVVTRGAVQVDWGVGTRRMVAGDDAWFPPLLVSPSSAGEESADAAASATNEERPVRAPKRAPRGVSTNPPAPGTATPAVPPENGQRDAAAAPGHEANDPATLMADADRARLAGRFEEGAALLERLVREYPRDPRAPLAAFSLGRLLLGELHRPAEAARAFARARALAPEGPLADDALAREAEAWTRAGDPDRARAREAEYRARTRTDGAQQP